MRCAVCGSAQAVEHRTTGGESYGFACVGVCDGLLWEACFNRAISAPPHEHALTLWRWKRHRAEVTGAPFVTPAPDSPGEIAVRAAVEAKGWTEYARQLMVKHEGLVKNGEP